MYVAHVTTWTSAWAGLIPKAMSVSTVRAGPIPHWQLQFGNHTEARQWMQESSPAQFQPLHGSPQLMASDTDANGERLIHPPLGTGH